MSQAEKHFSIWTEQQNYSAGPCLAMLSANLDNVPRKIQPENSWCWKILFKLLLILWTVLFCSKLINILNFPWDHKHHVCKKNLNELSLAKYFLINEYTFNQILNALRCKFSCKLVSQLWYGGILSKKYSHLTLGKRNYKEKVTEKKPYRCDLSWHNWTVVTDTNWFLWEILHRSLNRNRIHTGQAVRV